MTGLAAMVQRGLLALSIAAMLALFALVRPQSSDVPGRRNVAIWRVTGSEDAEAPVWEWFNESQDEIHARAVGLPFLEIEQKFLTASVGGIPPDAFEYFGPVAQWSTRGALMPLDEFMERDGFPRDSVYPALWDEMMFAGKTYAIPTGTASEAFFWNKEHFREAGLDPERPPQTWAELEEYAVRLTTRDADGSIDRAGYIPGYWSAMGTPTFLTWAVQNGAQFLSEDGRTVQLATKAGVEALEWETGLFERLGREALMERRSSFGQGAQHGFHAGKLSMIVNKSSFVQDMERFSPGIEYGAAPLPIPEGGRKAAMTGPVWIGIPMGASDPEASWEYIQFLTRTDVQVRQAAIAAENNIAGFMPANIQAAESPAQMALPHMDVFTQSMDHAQSSTVVPLAHTTFWREYTAAWESATRGDATPREALERAEREVQRALDEQVEYGEFYRGLVGEQ